MKKQFLIASTNPDLQVGEERAFFMALAMKNRNVVRAKAPFSIDDSDPNLKVGAIESSVIIDH